MKLFLLWSNLLVLWVLQSGTKGNSSDSCQGEREYDLMLVQNATKHDYVEKNETFVCLLHPSNELNCSWSFHTLEKDSRLSVHIRVCKGDVEVQSLEEESVGRDASATLNITEFEMSGVVLHFNMSLHDKWTAYTIMFRKGILELLPPPSHINASVEDKNLNVTWDRPRSRYQYNSRCFEYQLDMGDQKEHRTIQEQRWYLEQNANSKHTYRLRVRTRIFDKCSGSSEWSNWSHAVNIRVPLQVVEQSVYTLNPVVIVLLTLGIHLILASLLFLNRRRVLEVLFPPIPRPPPRYKYFLEKSDTFNFFYPAMPAKPEEEITEVEDIEKCPPNTS